MDQVKTCKSIDQAWKIPDIEFGDKQKLMDELVSRIRNLKPVKSDLKSLTRYATQIASLVNDMEDNDSPVTSSSEAPFYMSQLLSKLDSKDNADFGREMKKSNKEETVPNLMHWLHEEASLRSRGRHELVNHRVEQSQQQGNSFRHSDNHMIQVEEIEREQSPFG